MRLIKDVLAHDMCSGCGLCSSSPAGMEINNAGFARPINPIQDNLSEQACPGLIVEQFSTEQYDPIWGPVIESKTGYAVTSATRKMGSSGGVITAILEYCLDSNIVDAAVQIGVSSINPIRNEVKVVSQVDQLIENAGSRYAPSSPLSILRDLIGDGKKYVFVGKPCDVAALRYVRWRA